MESSSSSTSAPISADAVAKRTQELLIDMETCYKKTGSPANLILIIGRTGAGKSSLFEDLTDSSGYSQQSIGSVTQEYEIDKAIIDNKVYLIMDTPGFDPENEQKTFLEIVRGIKAIRHFARIAGVLYLTCINQPRFDGFDRKLMRFIRVLCGAEYFPRITFVTTFWTAAGAGQQTTFNQQLESLRGTWQEEFGGQQQPSLYQHGREYSSDGLDTGYFISWFEERHRVAQHGKNMIARRYGGPTNRIVTPKVVQEVDTNTPVHDMEAGKLLGLSPTSFPTASSHGPSGDPGEESAQRNTTPSGDSDPRPGHEGRPAAAQATTPSDSEEEPEPHQTSASSWNQVALDMVGWFARNVNFSIDLGSTERVPAFPMGNSYNGPRDPLSSVDVMNSVGLDSSRGARLRYAADRGIGGVPFSAEWGDAIRKDVLGRHR